MRDEIDQAAIRRRPGDPAADKHRGSRSAAPDRSVPRTDGRAGGGQVRVLLLIDTEYERHSVADLSGRLLRPSAGVGRRTRISHAIRPARARSTRRRRTAERPPRKIPLEECSITNGPARQRRAGKSVSRREQHSRASGRSEGVREQRAVRLCRRGVGWAHQSTAMNPKRSGRCPIAGARLLCPGFSVGSSNLTLLELEFVPGPSLSIYARRETPSSAEDAARIILRLMRGAGGDPSLRRVAPRHQAGQRLVLATAFRC